LTVARNIYAYVRGNPINDIDPSGLVNYPGVGFGPEDAQAMAIMEEIQAEINKAIGCAKRLPDFINFQIDILWGGSYSRSGNAFVGAGVNKGVPNPYRVSAGVSAGWVNSFAVSPEQVDNFLSGYSGGFSGAYALAGGGLAVSPGNGTATVVGVGAGEAIGLDTIASGTGSWGYTWETGQAGIVW
jgi:hypothetical protein